MVNASYVHVCAGCGDPFTPIHSVAAPRRSRATIYAARAIYCDRCSVTFKSERRLAWVGWRGRARRATSADSAGQW